MKRTDRVPQGYTRRKMPDFDVFGGPQGNTSRVQYLTVETDEPQSRSAFSWLVVGSALLAWAATLRIL
jgi:hypothetical protein